MPGEKYGLKLSTMEKIVIISVSISVIGLAIMGKYGYLALHIFPILSETQCPAFYTAIVTSLAAILAIVFAISLIAIQHAADKYTPSILERYKNDKKIIMIYVLFSIGIVFGILALWFGWTYIGAFTAFSLLVICLIFLYFQFRAVVDFVNPLKLIKTLKKETLNELIDKLKRGTLNEKWKKICKRNRKKIENDHIKRNCGILKEIAIKSIRRYEDNTCIESVKALKEIVEEYEEEIKKLPEESQKRKEELIADLQRLNLDTILPKLEGIGVTAARQRRGFVHGSGVMLAIESVYRSFGMVVSFDASYGSGMERYIVDESIRTIDNIGEEVVTSNKPDGNDLAAVIKSLRSLCEKYVSNKDFEFQAKGIILEIDRLLIKVAEYQYYSMIPNHQYYRIISDTLQFYHEELIEKRTIDAEIITLISHSSICMCAAVIKTLSQERDRQRYLGVLRSILNIPLGNKGHREYFDKAKEYCSDYKKEIEELKEWLEKKHLKGFKGEQNG